MSRETFEAQHDPAWRRYEAALVGLEKNQPQDWVAEFPSLYRQLCHHLALARQRRYGSDLEGRLNRLALRGHHQLYRRRGLVWATLGRFFARDFPRRVVAEWRLVTLCAVLFYGPLFAMMGAVWMRPELVYSVIDPEMVDEYSAMYAPREVAGRPAATDVGMFGFYIYNNISIAFRTFAGGILCGIGAIFFVVYNGLAIGAVVGHIARIGYGDQLFPFLAGHSSFELTALVLAGAAGLRLGLAILMPGRKTRRRALTSAARASVEMVYGIAAMLVLAALIEAFWSSSTLPPAVKYVAGATGWAIVGGYFAVLGRAR